MERIQIFVSFDGEHDADLQELLYSEAGKPGAAFDCTGCSQGGAMSDRWAASARNQIAAADEVVVICGEHSDASSRMAAELAIVHETGKPYMLLWGRRERMCTKPHGAKPTDAMYSWTTKILREQLSATLRYAKPIDVPESCKRRQH